MPESKIGSSDIVEIFLVGDRTCFEKGEGRSLLSQVKLNLAVVLSKEK
ncbi:MULTISPECIES: hypothetical protein [unclassified Microcoleus]